jgi:diacylglycerol O-acyltransferase
MQAAGALLPVPAHRWFANTVYGRRFFHGIVSNMPGPQQTLSLAGAPLLATFPVVPLAPGAPLSVGALGWDGELCVALLTDPGVVPDADRFAADVRSVVDELARAVRSGSMPTPA